LADYPDCDAILKADPTTESGVFEIAIDGTTKSVYCEMSESIGWTRVINLLATSSQSDYVNSAAYGTPENNDAFFKLKDNDINSLADGYYVFKVECGTFVRYAKRDAGWTSLIDGGGWKLDRNLDGVFDCEANRPGYIFADYPDIQLEGATSDCSIDGHMDWGDDSSSTNLGCYQSGVGWERAGAIYWAPIQVTEDPTCATGFANSGKTVCCAKSCGGCGGSNCGDNPGGSSACCGNQIKDSALSCDSNVPPCVMATETPTASTTGTTIRLSLLSPPSLLSLLPYFSFFKHPLSPPALSSMSMIYVYIHTHIHQRPHPIIFTWHYASLRPCVLPSFLPFVIRSCLHAFLSLLLALRSATNLHSFSAYNVANRDAD
jgi:hypothetical protein